MCRNVNETTVLQFGNTAFMVSVHELDCMFQVQGRQLVVTGRIFSVQSFKSKVMGKGNVLKLCVNFQPEVIALSKEVGICVLFGQVLCKTSSYMEVYFIETSHNLLQVRNLRWLGFRVPLAIVNKAHQANQLYPFAISLIESVKTYQRTLEKVRMKVTVFTKQHF